MKDEAWQRRCSRKIEEATAAGNRRAVTRLEFGRYVRMMRREKPGLSQSEAADLAGMSRSEWARIEAGRHLPRPHRLADMTDAIDVKVSALYRKAGYEVPAQYAGYDLKDAGKDFASALRESDSFHEFVARMQLVWQLFHREEKGERKTVLVDYGRARRMADIYEHMNGPERIKLARELVRSVHPKDIHVTLRDAADFLKDFERKVEMLGDDKSFP